MRKIKVEMTEDAFRTFSLLAEFEEKTLSELIDKALTNYLANFVPRAFFRKLENDVIYPENEKQESKNRPTNTLVSKKKMQKMRGISQ